MNQMDWRTPDGATRLILVRHGEPEESARGRCYGRLDVALSPEGLAQAEGLASWLAGAPIAAIYSSPLRRARETAEPIARSHGLPTKLREDLREIDFGEFEGLAWDEAAARFPEVYAAWMRNPTAVTFPEGESYARLSRRVERAVVEIRRAHERAAAVLVSHGGVNRAILASALSLRDADVFRLGQSYGAASIVDYHGEEPHVLLVNGGPTG